MRADIEQPVRRRNGDLAAEPDRVLRIMKRVQIEGAERPVVRTNNPKGGESLVGELAEPREHQDAHWFWLGARESDGRAVVRIQRSKRQVSRVLWALFRGAPSVEKVVRRTCDARGCINPWHASCVPRGSWQTDPGRVAAEKVRIEALLDEADLDWRDKDRVLSEAGPVPRLSSVRRAISQLQAEDEEWLRRMRH